MSILTANVTKHEFDPDQIERLIANDLGLPVGAIRVTYVIEPGAESFGVPNPPTVSKIRVTVDNDIVNTVENRNKGTQDESIQKSD